MCGLQTQKLINGPRERLESLGPRALSNSQLLAIVLNVGSKGESVFALADRIIKDYGVMNFVSEQSYERLAINLELGKVKAMQLLAMFELGRRIFKDEYTGRPLLNTPEKIYARYKFMMDKKREELRALYLDQNHCLLGEELLAVGNTNIVQCEIREILVPAFALKARAIVILHNHPSGNTDPSPQDIDFTKRLRQACRIVGVSLSDHIVIGQGYTSLVTGQFVD